MWPFRRKGASGFSSSSTAEEVTYGIDGSGLTAIVTGNNGVVMCSGLFVAILRNNAGIFATPFMLSEDNIELQFATNHMGHFLLTNLLLDTLKKTTHESKKQGRIVNVSSQAHHLTYRGGILFDKINDATRIGLHMDNQSLLTFYMPMNLQDVSRVSDYGMTCF
ncbi:Short-chain dehydrogenase TIC 32 [Spatholobus suberectus]|nr:Short-chain dehydrogenase TIC 32 [Spatholobus suberectus]